MAMTMNRSDELEALRTQIDALDAVLLETLARRAELVEQIGRYKKERGLAPLDSRRWRQVLETNLLRARELGLCPQFIESLFHLIHDYSLHLESNSEPHS